MQSGAFTDANGIHCIPGMIVQYGSRFNPRDTIPRVAVLEWVEQDGDATVKWLDTQQREQVNLMNLCAYKVDGLGMMTQYYKPVRDGRPDNTQAHVDKLRVNALTNARIPTSHGRLADWEIDAMVSIEPFVEEKTYLGCLSYGLSTCGYDVRLG